jgi:uncharacterized protein
MTITMYNASIPVFRKMLENLSGILTKGEAYAEARKIDPTVLLQARLYPDMFPLTKQVQIAGDFAKGAAARLAGIAVPSYADNEASFEELRARIAKTLAFMATIKPEQIDGSEEKPVSLTFGGETFKYKGLTYLNHVVMPNFYFHVTTAYDILRHNGVEVGKHDFVGDV